MSQYKILNIEEKTTQAGAKYKMFSLGEKGKTKLEGGITDGVSFWGKDEVKIGDYIEGAIEKNDKGYNTLKTPFKQGQGGAGMGVAMAKAQEKKKQDINEVQEKKVEGIKLSGCNRDATLILTSLGAKEDWQTKWLEIRKWLMDNYEIK